MFKPLVVAVHAVALALGLWLALASAGSPPGWSASGAVPRCLHGVRPRKGWQPCGARAARRLVALWVAWPCGLLQSALLVAAPGGHGLDGRRRDGRFAVATSASG
jgi:hypothetical protein